MRSARKPDPKVEREVMPCNDCGKPTDWLGIEAVAKGGANREPGEMVCCACNSSRSLMVRRCAALPNSLENIKRSLLSPMPEKRKKPPT